MRVKMSVTSKQKHIKLDDLEELIGKEYSNQILRHLTKFHEKNPEKFQNPKRLRYSVDTTGKPEDKRKFISIYEKPVIGSPWKEISQGNYIIFSNGDGPSGVYFGKGVQVAYTALENLL